MPRGARYPSAVFSSVLKKAKKRLLLDADLKEFRHKGVRGDERAAGLCEFLRERLPSRFSVTKGEVIDFRDSRTGQLDLVIYDSHTSAPVAQGKENGLIPAEALYAVIEVKTMLTAKELSTCYRAAGKLRKLRPFKRRYVSPRTKGAAADRNSRCIYSVFAYFSNLGQKDWLKKEYQRVVAAAATSNTEVDAIDRVLVLSRGIIVPGAGTGKKEDAGAQSVFLEFYLHLINFLTRESKRRRPIDWQLYGARTSPGWQRLT